MDTLYSSDVNGTIVKGIHSGNTANAGNVASVVLKSFKTPYVFNYTIANGPENTLNKSTEIINPNGTVSIAKRQNGNITLILYYGKIKCFEKMIKDMLCLD